MHNEHRIVINKLEQFMCVCVLAGDDAERDAAVHHPRHPDGERQVPRPQDRHQGGRSRRRQGG